MTPEERQRLEAALGAAVLVAPKARSIDHGLLFAVLNLRDNSAGALPELRALREVITHIPALQVFDHAMQDGPVTRLRVTCLDLLEWLVSRSQHTSTARAVEDLSSYLIGYQTHEPFEVQQILAIDGLEVTETIELGRLRLVPWSQLPDSDERYRIQVKNYYSNRSSFAALVHSITLKRRHAFPWDVPELYHDHFGHFTTLHDALRCVVVAQGAGIRMLNYWYEPPDGVPWFSNSSSFGIDSRSIALPQARPQVDPETLRRLFETFCALPVQRRERLRIPMDRLNNSLLAGIRFVDAAIEVGIALESLFGPIPKNSQITATLRRRLSEFLGSAATEKRDLSDLVSHAYDLRSRGVHDGHLGNAKVGSDHGVVLSVLTQMQEKVGEALRRFILEGEPSWPLARRGRRHSGRAHR
jgi:hypothetical protein